MTWDVATIAGIIGIVGSIGAAGGYAGKYYLTNSYVPREEVVMDYMKTEVAQTEFISSADLNKAFILRDIRDLKRIQRELDRIDPDIRTEKEQWQLHDVEDEIDELQQQLAE